MKDELIVEIWADTGAFKEAGSQLMLILMFLIDLCLCVLSALHFSAFIQYKCWCWFYHCCPALWAYFLYFILVFLIILTLCGFVWCIQPTLVDSQSSISFFFLFFFFCTANVWNVKLCWLWYYRDNIWQWCSFSLFASKLGGVSTDLDCPYSR